MGVSHNKHFNIRVYIRALGPPCTYGNYHMKLAATGSVAADEVLATPSLSGSGALLQKFVRPGLGVGGVGGVRVSGV